MKNYLKTVLFFEKRFAFCGGGAIFVKFLLLYKKSTKTPWCLFKIKKYKIKI